MSNASRHDILSAVSKCVTALIQQLTPDPETVCHKALRDLGAMANVAKTLTSVDVPSHFRAGIQEVINQLDAFRTGFARTAEQEGGENLLKAKTVDMSLEEFVKYADEIVRKAIKCAEVGALGSAVVALHTLASDIAKAESFTDTGSESISVTIENDPMKVVPTESAGSLNPSGTSAGSTAASNYVTNPGDVSASAPSTAPNASTASAAAATSSTPAGDSNFVAKAATDEAIAKGIDSIRTAVSKCEPMAKAQGFGWVMDLNSPEFRHGEKSRERF